MVVTQPQSCSTLLAPLAQSRQYKTSLLPSLNYTGQDYFSLKSRLISFIQQNFPTDFTDFVESDLGIMLIEIWAYIGDSLSFKADQYLNELFIDTVTETANAFRLAQLIGFMPTPPLPAVALVSASINTALPVDLVIQSGLQLTIGSTGTSLVFELFQADALNNPLFNVPITLGAGSLVNSSIVAVQGQTRNETFTSDGTINQAVQLTYTPVIFDSISVAVDGTQWTQVPYYTDSQPRSEYRVEFDSNWTGYVLFGNGTAGRVPGVGSQIAVTYRTGGGTVGNIVTGAISEQRGVQVPGLGYTVPVTFRNYTAAQNGYDGMTADDVRFNLPAYAATQNRAVTGLDYKTLAEQFVTPYNGQIGKATAVLRNYGCAGNVIDIYVLALAAPNSLTTASDQLKLQLTQYMQTVQMFTDFVCIEDGVVLTVDVHMDVQLNSFYQKFSQQIITNVTNTVNNFFALNNWDYGQSLKETDLLKALSLLQEPSAYTISFVTSDPANSGNLVVAEYYEVIRPGNIIITTTFV